MKKFILSMVFAIGAFSMMSAQLQQGNWMVGGQVANVKFTNGFNLNLTPQVGYFIKDNWAIGAKLGLGVFSPENSDDTQTNWDIGGFTRYYFANSEIKSFLNNGAFFGQASAGFGGMNSDAGSSTNGLDLGIGVGYSYFVTNTVGLEAMLGYGGNTGGGNDGFQGDLNFNIGFQIYLPSATAKAALKDEQ